VHGVFYVQEPTTVDRFQDFTAGPIDGIPDRALAAAPWAQKVSGLVRTECWNASAIEEVAPWRCHHDGDNGMNRYGAAP